jgi:hypothetical protein
MSMEALAGTQQHVLLVTTVEIGGGLTDQIEVRMKDRPEVGTLIRLVCSASITPAALSNCSRGDTAAPT